MYRPLAAVAGTIAGLAALLSYKSGAPPTRLTTPTTAGSESAATPAPTSAAAPPVASESPSTTAPARTPVTRTGTGPDVPNRYGDVQVRVTMRGTQIVEVTPIVLPTDRPRSAQISQQAAPILRSEALQAQSANIDIVSGATYTSESYARSLQGAIDAARAS
ncbi:MAG: FMN-binding protein [Actinobacteria bacterium]|nr:FMN-binding protein [Actinomycetota bacterium]